MMPIGQDYDSVGFYGVPVAIWIISALVFAAAALLIWLLVNGFRTGRMDALRALGRADRATQPKMFWFNTMLNVGWLVGCLIVLAHIATTGEL